MRKDSEGTCALQFVSSKGKAQPGLAPTTALVRVEGPELHVAATVNRQTNRNLCSDPVQDVATEGTTRRGQYS